MRRFILSLALLGLCCLVVFQGQSPAADEPDSVGAKATREKTLKQKLKVEYDGVMLREILKELPDLVKAETNRTIRIVPLPGSGITLTSRFTIKGEMTVEEILEVLIKEKNWGWYVISTKVGDQNDGGIFLTTNPKEHGYKEGTGPMGKDTGKKEVVKKEDPKTKEKPKDEPKTEPKGGDEKAAADLLSKAKFLKSTKQLDKCKETLNEIISKHADTKAAADAKKLLESLDK